MAKIFKNPENGYTEESGGTFSWLWCFLFGWWYFINKGNGKHAILSFVLFWPTLGMSQIVYAFLVYSINAKYYRQKGWIEVANATTDKKE